MQSHKNTAKLAPNLVSNLKFKQQFKQIWLATLRALKLMQIYGSTNLTFAGPKALFPPSIPIFNTLGPLIKRTCVTHLFKSTILSFAKNLHSGELLYKYLCIDIYLGFSRSGETYYCDVTFPSPPT